MQLASMRNLKLLILNFSFRSSADILIRFLGLITFPIIIRALGPEGYGTFTLITVIMQFTLIPVSLLGLRSYGVREIAERKEKETNIVSNIISAQLMTIIITIPISLGIVLYFFNSQIFFLKSIIIGYIIIIAYVFNIDFFFIAKKNLIVPTISNLIGQLIFIGGVILFVKDPENLSLLILLSGLAPLISALIQIIKYIEANNKIFIRFSIKDVILLLRKTYKLGISTNLEVFYPSIPIILLPIILNNYYLGIYSAGYKIFSIMAIFYVTFFYALAPYFVQLKEFNSTRRVKYIFLLFTVVLFGGILIGLILFFFGDPFLSLLFGKSFGESVQVFKLISLTLIPFWPVFMLLGNIFIYFSVEKYYLLSMLVATITVAVSAPFLIFDYGVLGAVYSMSFSLFAGIITAGYFLLKIEPEILISTKQLLLKQEKLKE
jgi:polysaccharide transporter, PST family